VRGVIHHGQIMIAICVRPAAVGGLLLLLHSIIDAFDSPQR
jgi:hypothetical protein